MANRPTMDDDASREALLRAIMQGQDARSSVEEVAERLNVSVDEAQSNLDHLVAEEIVTTEEDLHPMPGRERLYWVNHEKGLAEADRLGM